MRGEYSAIIHCIMNNNILETLPEPFRQDQFSLFQKGIFDDPSIDVYINNEKSFAYLSPLSITNYDNYSPRAERLNLREYKSKLKVWEKRFNKISKFLNGRKTLLEIGAGDGSFLRLIKEKHPAMKLNSIDKDKNTAGDRKRYSSVDYNDLKEAIAEKRVYDVICFFHTMEHIVNPGNFLSGAAELMSDDSLLIIEVPSLLDPLLTLYNCLAYKKFYFQRQHPYVYSAVSLKRLLEFYGFKTREIINYQRYGLENHLNWLTNQTPGGNETYQLLFSQLEASYLNIIEKNKMTDTVFWIGGK